MDFRHIDLAAYPRKAHFDYFRALPWPYVGVTAEADVTALLRFCKSRRRSFYLAFMHAAALAANGVDALRQRIRDGGIVEYSQCPTSHIELKKDGSYCYCTLRHDMPLDEYFEQAEAARAACKDGGVEEDEDVESMLFISTLPWVRYTSLLQPVAGGDESNPRITWGKYADDPSGRVTLPVSLLAHHALVDGIHIARFYQTLEENLKSFGDAP